MTTAPDGYRMDGGIPVCLFCGFCRITQIYGPRECCAEGREYDECPHCDKCKAPLVTGMMAMICPYGDECEFFPSDPEGQAFVREWRSVQQPAGGNR